jgi:hypothetical protein
MLGSCFVGFRTVLDGMQIDFDAFVQEPGDYQGDYFHILLLSVELVDGRAFFARANDVPYGEIYLHALTVSPRFSGSVDATLYDRNDGSAPPLSMSLTFDVEGSPGCGK